MNSNSLTILLVEDNACDVALTLRAFKLHKIENKVVVARDGVEALDYLFGTGTEAKDKVFELPGLVLLDLNLPRVNGLEVLRRIRADQRTKLVPVVMLTTSAEEGDVQACYQSGVNSYVQKLVDFNKFSEELRQIGSYWLTINVNPPMHSDKG